MKNSLEIILDEDIQNIFDHYAACFNMSILFYAPDGKILRRSKKNSAFCELIQNKIFGREKCITLDETKRRECLEKKGIVSYRCHAGIEEAIAPIYIEKKLAGYAMIGQFRSTKHISSKLCTKCSGKTRKKLEIAFEELPYFPPSKVKDILGLFSVISEYIVAREMIVLKGDRLINRTQDWISNNFHRKITLAEAAKHTGRSCSTLSHQFRQKLGLSFQEAVINARLDRAEQYFRENPELSIQEVAAKIGYDDQYYFSRIYKKYRLRPPRDYRNYIRKNH
jgi:AraC-like DNA-binding protein